MRAALDAGREPRYVSRVAISGRYSGLTPTAWTVLGFLSFCPRNGYQLRQAVRRSVGHFWGVSYGQLYPQLKKLAQEGLIEPAPEDPQVWRLTEEGAQALREWLGAPPEATQRRDEGMVKLLFSDHGGTAVTRQLVAGRREEARVRRDEAEQTKPGAHWNSDRDPDELLAAFLVRSHTLALAEAELAWCDTADAMIDEQEAKHRAR